MEEFSLTVVYTSKPGKRQTFIDEIVANNLLELIRSESGCISYDYYISEDDEDRIMLIEKWESEIHQQQHLSQPHMKKLKEIKEQYIDNTKIERY